MTDYCGVWGNPIISSNPIIMIMDDVPFCTIEIFSDFSDNYMCTSEKKKSSEMRFDRTIVGLSCSIVASS